MPRRSHLREPGSIVSLSVTATIGGVRVADRAGGSVAATVVTTPTPTATATIDGVMADPASGTAVPSESSAHSINLEKRSPSGRPMIEAASRDGDGFGDCCSHDLSWRRAPTTWLERGEVSTATVNRRVFELATVKAPTTRARPANPRMRARNQGEASGR